MSARRTVRDSWEPAACLAEALARESCAAERAGEGKRSYASVTRNTHTGTDAACCRRALEVVAGSRSALASRDCTSRCNAASCATPRGDLVSCGGYITGGTFVDTVEIYEPRLKASRMLPPMPHGVYGGRACCVGDQLFVVGGQSCEEVR